MAIIMISSMSHSGREELAETLAQKTGWPLLSREELVERARDMGIKTGRLEVSVIKNPGLPERLAQEKDLYLAFVTAAICEKARDGNLIYHGRAGHMLLPGVSHRLRVGLTAPLDLRAKRAAAQLNITPDKALTYLEQLDEDLAKWIRYVHRVDCREPSQYDFFINMANMAPGNVATVLCEMADLPDFRPTPASLKLVADLNLAAEARLKLALDERTAGADLEIRADNGILTVTYPPRQQAVTDKITSVLKELAGCQAIQCTQAETNILWVQEDFSPNSENFKNIIQLAQRWGAAVELLRLLPPGDPAAATLTVTQPAPDQGLRPDTTGTGGVEDDGPTTPDTDLNFIRTGEELIAQGRSGGLHTVCGGYDKILETARGNGNYSLVVIGDMFLTKDKSARTRQTRELAVAIRDRLKAPVITADELQSRFLFGKAQALKLLITSVVTFLVYYLVFTHQDLIMNLLGGEATRDWRWLAALSVGLVVPCVAFLYGTVTGLLLKLVNVD